MDQHSAPVRTDHVYAALPRAMELATEYLAGLPHRPVDAITSYDEVIDALSGPLPDQGTNAVSVVEQLAATLGPATIACAGPRYFGLVVGERYPRRWLPTGWYRPGTRPRTAGCRRQPALRSMPSPSAGFSKLSGCPHARPSGSSPEPRRETSSGCFPRGTFS